MYYLLSRTIEKCGQTETEQEVIRAEQFRTLAAMRNRRKELSELREKYQIPVLADIAMCGKKNAFEIIKAFLSNEVYSAIVFNTFPGSQIFRNMVKVSDMLHYLQSKIQNGNDLSYGELAYLQRHRREVLRTGDIVLAEAACIEEETYHEYMRTHEHAN